MLSPTAFFFAVVFFAGLFCTPVFARRYPCDDILIRKEWRNMNTDEQAEYIRAVKCLQTQPAVKPAYPAAHTRFDEFQAHYMKQADNVHNLGQFLPWHRHYLRTYENALRTECGYKGATPYWDWSQDADSNSSISAAPVFHPVTGFGGDGVPGTYTFPSNNSNDNTFASSTVRGCVRTGPFSNYTLSLGPGQRATSHCLTRGITDSAKEYLTSAAVASAMESEDFEAFRQLMEGEPGADGYGMADGGRLAVGGEMSNDYSGSGDPLFYLHHANIDRIWWNWQQLAPSTRFFSISGPATRTNPVHEVGVDYVLYMGSLGLSVPVREVLDLWSKPNCYSYA